MPRRRRARAVAVEADSERGFAMRILLHSPKDVVAGAFAVAAVIAIVANALFLQAGRHPSPMFGSAVAMPAALAPASPLPRPRPANVVRPPAPIPASAGRETIANPSPGWRRVAAVQRALTEYGYGQLKPTGTVSSDTQAAIQKFERERKLPVTGQMSDRLVRELIAVTGRPIE